MSKCFREGFKYVFTKKKFMQVEGKGEYKIHRKWVNECNGRIVKVIGNKNGEIGKIEFGVYPEWCKSRCIRKS